MPVVACLAQSQGEETMRIHSALLKANRQANRAESKIRGLVGIK